MGRLLQSSGGIAAGDSPTWTGTHTFAAGTITTSQPISQTQTWNASGVTFKGLSIAITNTASAAASRVIDALVGGTSMFSVAANGDLRLNGATNVDIFRRADVNMLYLSREFSHGAAIGREGHNVGLALGSIANVLWTNDTPVATADLYLNRIAANILRLTSNGTTGGAAFQMYEMTAPAAPAANAVRLYAVDNGAGKTQLMALFASGAAQQVAIEP